MLKYQFLALAAVRVCTGHFLKGLDALLQASY